MTIGDPDDLRAATLDDVHAFFRRYYHPGNASLALAGDIDTQAALDLAARYFGEIERGPDVAAVDVAAAPLQSEVRLLLEDRVELPRLYAAWHSPALFGEGDAHLDLVAEVLAGGKTSRLYRSLVYEQRIATEVAASQNSREMSSYFQIVATAAPGHTLGELQEAIARELQSVVDPGPAAAEMERCLAQAESHFLYRLQTVGGFGGKSDQLNAYNVYLGDPAFFARDLERYRRATAAHLRDAAARWLGAGRVVLSVVPKGRRDLAIAGSESAAVA